MKLPIVEYRNDLIRNSSIIILFLCLLYVVAFYGENKSIYAILAFTSLISLILSIDGLVFRKTGFFNIESDRFEINRNSTNSFSINHSDISWISL